MHKISPANEHVFRKLFEGQLQFRVRKEAQNDLNVVKKPRSTDFDS